VFRILNEARLLTSPEERFTISAGNGEGIRGKYGAHAKTKLGWK
jgi:hypothetical protein